MIPKKYRAAELIGRQVTTDSDIETRGGKVLVAGSVAWIERCVGGIGGITVRTHTCPECGQSIVVSHLKRDVLTLVESDAGKDEIVREVRRTVWRLRKTLEHRRFDTAVDVVELRDELLWAADKLKDAEAKLCSREAVKG